MSLNDPWVKEEIKRETEKYLETNEVKMQYWNFWNAAKAALRRKFTQTHTHTHTHRNEESLNERKKTNFTLQGTRKRTKPKVRRKKKNKDKNINK